TRSPRRRAGGIAAAPRAGEAAPVGAVLGARLGRAAVQHERARRADRAGRRAVVAEPARARARIADRAGHEARLLPARRASGAARDGALAVHVELSAAHRVPDVTGDAA